MDTTQSSIRVPYLISFSGIDGAGKSTQIQMLCDRLSDAGLRVHLLAFWDDVAMLTGLREFASCRIFKSAKGVGTPENPVERRDKNVQTWYMTPIRYLVCTLDTFALMISVFLAKVKANDVVIFDRYLYDELANLPLRSFFTRTFIRLMVAVGPSPQIAYLLDADPDRARERKPEYPLEFLWKNRANYLRIAKLAKMTVVEPGSVDEVSGRILQQFSKLVPSINLDTPQPLPLPNPSIDQTFTSKKEGRDPSQVAPLS
jgi:thymidylate kinase